jgi:hypothetical protein
MNVQRKGHVRTQQEGQEGGHQNTRNGSSSDPGLLDIDHGLSACRTMRH